MSTSFILARTSWQTVLCFKWHFFKQTLLQKSPIFSSLYIDFPLFLLFKKKKKKKKKEKKQTKKNEKKQTNEKRTEIYTFEQL